MATSNFTEPWDFGDTVFVVQCKKLYVNKTILSMVSSVFKTMLTSDFKEKSAVEIPLPKKKYNELLILFRLIHTPCAVMEYKDIHFLLPLAREYMMKDVLTQAEKFLQTVTPVKMEMLSWADEYSFTNLRKYCMDYANKSKLETLHEDAGFRKVCDKTKVEILYERCRTYELLISRNEGQLAKHYHHSKAEMKANLNGHYEATGRYVQTFPAMPYTISWLKK